MSSLPSSVGPAASGTGKTTRMVEYAIAEARKGNKLAIIANSEVERHRLTQLIRWTAQGLGCEWVVGQGITGGPGGNIEVYHVSHCLVGERTPGEYHLVGIHDREILVDNLVLEDRYRKVLENYQRWL